MSASAIIEKMRLSGLSLHTDGGDLIVSPPGRLTERQRDYLRRHKVELLAALLDGTQPGNDIDPANDPPPVSIDHLPLRLRAAATRVCLEMHSDQPEAIAAMLEALANYPAEDWPKLIEHFEMQLPDDDFDNRRTCRDCLNLTSRGTCRAAQQGAIPTAVSTWRPDPERLRRCVAYRPGMELVPGIATEGTP